MFPINVILFQGGLGNQMFQYANALEVCKRHPLELMLYESNRSVETHGGLLLFDVFDIKEKWRFSLHGFIERHFSKLLKSFRREDYNGTQTGGCLSRHFLGFYQSELHFAHCKKTVRKAFKFNTDKLNNRSREVAKQMSSQQCISIHIRRGDYLNENGRYDTYSLDYYRQALQYIEKRVGACKVYIFSDEIDWCHTNFSIPNAIYVDWNTGTDSWQDMCLMSLCHYNIIANSTFSWWGAWLNPHPDKLVVAPKRWTTSDDMPGIIPSGWITL